MAKEKLKPTVKKKGGAPKGNQNALNGNGGRPSAYREEYNQIAFNYCLLGLTDNELADLLSISESTLNEWKKKHIEFSESIRAGKEKADSIVAGELYRGAQDRIVVEQQAFKVKKVRWNAKGQREETEEVVTVPVEKVIPADFRNQQFWLKNRKSDKWRDKQDLDIKTDGESLNKSITPDEAKELLIKLQSGDI